MCKNKNGSPDLENRFVKVRFGFVKGRQDAYFFTNVNVPFASL